MEKCLGSGRHHWNLFFSNSNSANHGWDDPTLVFSFADILMVPEAEIQYDNYNNIFDGEHNNLLALDTTLEEWRGEWVPLPEAVIFL